MAKHNPQAVIDMVGTQPILDKLHKQLSKQSVWLDYLGRISNAMVHGTPTVTPHISIFFEQKRFLEITIRPWRVEKKNTEPFLFVHDPHDECWCCMKFPLSDPNCWDTVTEAIVAKIHEYFEDKA